MFKRYLFCSTNIFSFNVLKWPIIEASQAVFFQAHFRNFRVIKSEVHHFEFLPPNITVSGRCFAREYANTINVFLQFGSADEHETSRIYQNVLNIAWTWKQVFRINLQYSWFAVLFRSILKNGKSESCKRNSTSFILFSKFLRLFILTVTACL